ncbi:signal peptidase II [Dysosmobacter sp.]
MFYAVFALAAAAGVALDQWLKAYVTANIPVGQARPLWPGVVELRTVHNYGAAWSSFSGMRWLLVAVTAAIVLTVAAAVCLRLVRHPLGAAACCMIVSGGLGNLADRVRLGYVVDMFNLEFMNYPVFNVADILVVCGAVLGVVYYLWFYEKYDQKKDDSHGTADASGQ